MSPRFGLPLALCALLSAILVSVMLLSHAAYSGGSEAGMAPPRRVIHQDFESGELGSHPENWTIVSAGYGPGAIWIEENFQGDNRFLRMASYSNMRALLVHALNTTSPILRIQLRVRIHEEQLFPEIQDPVAFALGLVTDSGGLVPLLELGKSTNRTIMPLNVVYDQKLWLPFSLGVDISLGSSDVYVWNRSVGRRFLQPVSPSTVEGLYVYLGTGGWYVGEVDDVVVDECPVREALVSSLLLTAVSGSVSYQRSRWTMVSRSLRVDFPTPPG